jgi:hypothetical protein
VARTRIGLANSARHRHRAFHACGKLVRIVQIWKARRLQQIDITNEGSLERRGPPRLADRGK